MILTALRLCQIDDTLSIVPRQERQERDNPAKITPHGVVGLMGANPRGGRNQLPGWSQLPAAVAKQPALGLALLVSALSRAILKLPMTAFSPALTLPLAPFLHHTKMPTGRARIQRGGGSVANGHLPAGRR
jgi:hypothetical protein